MTPLHHVIVLELGLDERGRRRLLHSAQWPALLDLLEAEVLALDRQQHAPNSSGPYRCSAGATEVVQWVERVRQVLKGAP